MHFSNSVQPFKKRSFKKTAGLAAALMVLPVMVACAGEPTAETDDLTSEVPESIEGDPAVVPTVPEAASESIVDVAAADGSFNTLVAAVEAAGLDSTLSADGPYTVFAPTDEAFASLPEGVGEKLAKPENQAALREVLAYHVVEGEVPAAEIESGSISTVEGESLEVAVDDVGVVVNGDANVIQPDIVADNGVIHVVDTVLLPPTFDPATLI